MKKKKEKMLVPCKRMCEPRGSAPGENAQGTSNVIFIRVNSNAHRVMNNFSNERVFMTIIT